MADGTITIAGAFESPTYNNGTSTANQAGLTVVFYDSSSSTAQTNYLGSTQTQFGFGTGNTATNYFTYTAQVPAGVLHKPTEVVLLHI